LPAARHERALESASLQTQSPRHVAISVEQAAEAQSQQAVDASPTG
jgi:hypothetical protein